MSNKYDYLFDPNWSELKIVSAYHGEIDKVKDNPDDLEELRQAFLKASDEHNRRISKREKEKNIYILE